jgi:hypothetical protein
MLVATSSFQSGAIEHAKVNDVALVQFVSGSLRNFQASIRSPQEVLASSLAQKGVEPYVGFIYVPDPTGRLVFPQLLGRGFTFELYHYLEAKSAQPSAAAGEV